ncbi:MAG: methyltransferase domain-containing protein, partial [Ktedonobacterales bacterium]
MTQASTTSGTTTAADITERVRARYAAAATSVRAGGCCGAGACDGTDVTAGNYTAEDVSLLPEEAALASLGCGNPTALIELREGETVLDLGSGGGIDVLLSARRVGPTGFVYGLDMTDEMLAL